MNMDKLLDKADAMFLINLAQRCECIREFIEKEMKKEQEKHD